MEKPYLALVTVVTLLAANVVLAAPPVDGQRALSFGAEAIFDVLANVSGGLDTGVEVPGVINLKGEGFWRAYETGGSHRLNVTLQSTVGGSLSRDHVGDIQTVSSVEALNTVQVFEAWYEYALPDDRAAVLIGLHDLNSEFYALDRASLLVNSSFGIGPDIGQTNASQFPTTALGARVRYASDTMYGLAAVYDGVPGDPSDPYGTHVQFDDGDGVFIIGEAGLGGSEPDGTTAKAGIGIWHTTTEFEDLSGTRRDANSGIYFVAEGPFASLASGTGLGGFVHVGLARASRNPIGVYIGSGLHWSSPFGRSNGDAMSLGIAHTRLTDEFRRAEAVDTDAETAIELTYSRRINGWISVQPDIQYVIDPASAGVDDALLIGTRLVFTLP